MIKKASRTTKFLIFVGLMLLVFVVSLNIYQNVVNTPKKIFIDALNNLSNNYQTFNKLEKMDYNFFDKEFKYDGNIDISINSKLLNAFELDEKYNDILEYIDFLNSLEITYNLQKQGSKLLLNLNGKSSNDNLNILYYYLDNNHYLKFDNYDNSYININSLVDIIKNKIIYLSDQDYLIDFIVKDFIDNLNDDYFSVVKDNINLDGEQFSVNKNILTLDRKTVTTILNQILSDLKEDEKASSILKSVFSNFDNFNIDISENRENDIVLYFNTYTNNNNLIKYDLEISNIKSITNLNTERLTISFMKEKPIIDILLDDEKIAYIKFSNGDNKILAELYFNDSKILTFEIDNTNTSQNISIASGTLLNNSFNLSLSKIIDQNVLDDYDKLENKLLLKLKLVGFDILNFEISNKANISNNSNIDVSLNKIKGLEDLSTEDYEKIKNIFIKFLKNDK